MFDETLATALKVQLGQSPFLDIVTDQRIAETLRLMGRQPDERLTHAVALEACQRMGVKAMIEGSIAPLGTTYVMTLSATDCQSGETLAREQAESPSGERVLKDLGENQLLDADNAWRVAPVETLRRARSSRRPRPRCPR